MGRGKWDWKRRRCELDIGILNGEIGSTMEGFEGSEGYDSRSSRVLSLLQNLSSCGTIMFAGSVLWFVIGKLTLGSGTPRENPFFVADAGLWNVSNEDTVPFMQLVIVFLAAFIPAMLILEILVRIGNWSFAEVVKSFFRFAFGLMGSVAITGTFVDIAKRAVGELRPDFYSRCYGHEASLPTSDMYSDVIKDNQGCNGDNLEVLNSGRRSFPSGHAGIAMAGSFFMTLYFLYVAKRLKRPWLSQIIFFVAMVPFSYGLWVSLTRVIDNVHHPADIVGGALLGITVSSLYYVWTISLEPNGLDADKYLG